MTTPSVVDLTWYRDNVDIRQRKHKSMSYAVELYGTDVVNPGVDEPFYFQSRYKTQLLYP
jgi:hypothetical protein